MKNKNLVILFLVFMTLGLWHQIIISLNLNRTLYPTPYSVFTSLTEAEYLYDDILTSLVRLMIGSLSGIICGVAFGISTGHFSNMDETIGKVSNFFRFIPPMALVPLFLLWFGIGETSKISLLAWTCFFPIWISTHNGVQNIEGKYLLVAESLEINGFSFMKEVIFKGSMNYILNGVRIGVGVAFSVLVAAEMLGAYSGLGYRIFFLQSVYRVDRMLAYILLLGFLGMCVDLLFLHLSGRLTPWENEGQN